MSRGTVIVLAAALAGCSEYDVRTGGDAQHGVEEVTTAPGAESTPSDFTWDGGEDPGTPASGGGSGAIRPDEPVPEEPPADDEEDGGGGSGATPEHEDDGEEPSTEPDPEDPEDPEEPGDEDYDVQGRMTGGGSLWDGDSRVTHGFTLRCDPDWHANRLQINWDNGSRFHLTELTAVACWDDPAYDPRVPKTTFDTMWATGVGSLDGVDGVEIELIFIDDGEPGSTDEAWLSIDGGQVMDFWSVIDMGNHQAHGSPSMAPPAGTTPTYAELYAAGLADGGEAEAKGCATVPGAAGGWLVLIGALAFRRREA